MTDPQFPDGSVTVTITAGAQERDIVLHMPTGEQLLVAHMALEALDGTDDMETAIKFGTRVIRTVLSMIAKQEDRDWVTDRMAEGMLTIQEFQQTIAKVAMQPAAPTTKPKLKPAPRAKR